MYLHVLDVLLTIFHTVIVGFNLLGWIWPRTRRLHLVCVGVTAGCWYILGIWFGWGYCPVTDWQWHVKTALGEHNLPGSFIKYYADKIAGTNINPQLADVLIGACFFTAAALSLWLNFFRGRGRKDKH
jgi:hypothetical protein